MERRHFRLLPIGVGLVGSMIGMIATQIRRCVFIKAALFLTDALNGALPKVVFQ